VLAPELGLLSLLVPEFPIELVLDELVLGTVVLVVPEFAVPLLELAAPELPAMLPAVFCEPDVVEEVDPFTPGDVVPVEPLVFETVKLSLTLRLPAYCFAIFLALRDSSFDATVPFSSTVLSVTDTVMLSLLRLESLFKAFWIWVWASPVELMPLVWLWEFADDVVVVVWGVVVLVWSEEFVLELAPLVCATAKLRANASTKTSRWKGFSIRFSPGWLIARAFRPQELKWRRGIKMALV
jgi:hypothetical protein